MALEVSNLDKGAPDVDAVLDECHALSVANSRPKWACPGQPYPSRNDFTRMRDDAASTVVLCREDGVLVGWNLHDPMGHIMGAGLRNGDLDGAGDVMSDDCIVIETAIAAQIRVNAGAVYHMSFGNKRQWRALQVQCGISPSPLPEFAPFVAQGPPALADVTGA